MATVLLYAVDLDEMRRWIGSGDATLVREGMAILTEDEDADWEAEELALLERLLVRLVMDGRLYEGLGEEERYYLTQLLVDLFDELVESEPLSDELSYASLEKGLGPVRDAGGVAAQAAMWVTRGRLLGSDEVVWSGPGEPDEILPYLGFVTRAELPALTQAVGELLREGARPAGRKGGRAAGKFRSTGIAELSSACQGAQESERDLVAFVS